MKKLLFTFLPIFLLCILTSASAQTIHYVKEAGTGDGSSWASASDDLQLMINNSVEGDQVWVAGGIYYPIRKANALNTVSMNNRDNAFVLKNDVKIYGGFPGINETNLTQRDSTRISNNTILSGDIGTIGDNKDNAYHVVISAGDVGSAELNGFSIKDGNADGTGSIVVSTESISHNYGGGISNSNASPVITNLTLSGSNATRGGGIYNTSSSSPFLTNVTISKNNATSAGGAIYNSSSSPILMNVIISENNAKYGGGIYNSSSSPILNYVTISENNATSNGGGIQNENSSPVLTNVTINGNNANSSNGGGIYNGESSPILTNVSISGNSGYRGGGIFNYQSSPVLTNVTISGNNASGAGGGIFNSTDTHLEIRNSIVSGNSDGIGWVSTSFSVISYSLVQGVSPYGYQPNRVVSNILVGTVDPKFISMPSFDTAPFTDGDYRVKTGSLVIDMGNDDYYSPNSVPDLSAITTDLDGNQRKTGTVDMGAYEYFSALPVTISNFTAQAEGNRAKLTWSTATEISNKEFIISRSADGITFSEIGSMAGAGNTSNRRDYIYYDDNPMNGNNFYQLEQLDFDGRRAVAGIRNVQFASLSRINIYPNPVKHTLHLGFKPGMFQKSELTDVNGRLLKVSKIGANDSRQELNLSTFRSGTYFIRLTGDGKVETRRVVKE